MVIWNRFSWLFRLVFDLVAEQQTVTLFETFAALLIRHEGRRRVAAMLSTRQIKHHQAADRQKYRSCNLGGFRILLEPVMISFARDVRQSARRL